MPNIITYAKLIEIDKCYDLVEKETCREQLVLFKRIFGESVDLT